MAKIKLIEKKPKSYNRTETPSRELRRKAYNSQAWRDLRLTYIMAHPMCEDCKRKPAVDIHHIKSFVVNNEIDWGLLLDDNNLKALCKECHSETHNRQSGHQTNKKTIEELNNLLNNLN